MGACSGFAQPGSRHTLDQGSAGVSSGGFPRPFSHSFSTKPARAGVDSSTGAKADLLNLNVAHRRGSPIFRGERLSEVRGNGTLSDKSSKVLPLTRFLAEAETGGGARGMGTHTS